MLAFVGHVLVTGLLAATATAVTPISDNDMNQLLGEGGISLAMKAQPMFFFGQAMNRPPCIPTFAVVNGQQTPASKLCDYPNVGCDCRNPGVGIGNPSPSFPIYYTYSKCSDTSVRIAYNLFYTKDGTNPNKVFGHPYDWERVIVVWTKAVDGQWRPGQLFLSQHSGYGRLEWAKVQNTFNEEDGSKPRGGDNGRTYLDHPKVYVEWSKHAIRDTRRTGYNDPISQLTDNAFRSQDWWYFPKREDYIRSDRSTDIGRLLGSLDWGDASSNPPSVHDGLCTA